MSKLVLGIDTKAVFRNTKRLKFLLAKDRKIRTKITEIDMTTFHIIKNNKPSPIFFMSLKDRQNLLISGTIINLGNSDDF